MQIKSSLVVRVLDDYTGKGIGEPLKLLTEEGRPPVAKGDGYYVFTDLKETAGRLLINHPQYQSTEYGFVLEGEVPPEFVLRLVPGRGYRGIETMTVIEGASAANSRLFLCPRCPQTEYRLYKDYTAEDGAVPAVLSLYYTPKITILGCAFCIEQEGEREFFRIRKKEYPGRWEYVTEKPLCRSYNKMQARIYPVYEADTDGNGSFMAVVREKLKDEALICACRIETQEWEKDGYDISILQRSGMSEQKVKEKRNNLILLQTD